MGLPLPEPDRFDLVVGRLIHVPGSVVWMMEHEVTQAEWRKVIREDPSGFPGCDACPVERVTWSAATAFATELTRQESQAFRLPTEEEWRLAAGQAFPYAGSDDVGAVGWYADNSGARTHPVCEKQRTSLGFCDLTGNVWEWTATPDGPGRVLLGGGWFDSAAFARLDTRLASDPANRHAYLGFRLVHPEPKP